MALSPVMTSEPDLMQSPTSEQGTEPTGNALQSADNAGEQHRGSFDGSHLAFPGPSYIPPATLPQRDLPPQPLQPSSDTEPRGNPFDPHLSSRKIGIR